MHQPAQLVFRSLAIFIALLIFVDVPAAQCLPVPLGPLVSGDPDANDYFGTSVDMDGGLAVVGAPGDDEKGNAAGAAYVFEWDGLTWVETAKLTASDALPSDGFGKAVAISGNRLVVGAPDNDAGGASSGAVYVFEYFPTLGWLEAMKVWRGPNERFGSTVALHGDVFAAGTNYPKYHAYLYRNAGGIWNFEKTVSIYQASGNYATAVALSEDLFAVGNADYDAGVGSKHGRIVLLEYSSSSWSVVKTLTGSNDEYLGYALDVEVDRLVSGCRTRSARVFVKDTGGWPDTGLSLNGPSFSVAVSGDRVLIGTTDEELYLYQESLAGWKLVSQNLGSGAQVGDSFGGSVAIDPEKFLAGASRSDLGTTDAGAVFTFGFKNVETYCTPKATTIPNCYARINGIGTPSASTPEAFEMTAGFSPGKQVGIFFWSRTGPAAIPFQLGYLCVQSPVLRSKGILSGGTKGNCDGMYRMLLSDLAARDPQFGAGLNYYVQAWFRDPGNAFSSSLSNALWFVVCN